MIKKIIVFAALALGIFSYACNDSIDPKTTFQERFTLYCILNADTTFQTAYISHSYDVDGYDPLTNTTDPALDSAAISLNVNGKTTYNMTATSTARTDTSRYKTAFKYYALNNYKPNDEDVVVIKAVLKNGKILTSTLTTPPTSAVEFLNEDTQYPSASTISGLNYSWVLTNNFKLGTIVFYAPKLELVYVKADNPTKKIRISVPKYFLPVNGSDQPVYQGVSTGTSVKYYDESMDRVMASISEGDANKSNYIFYYAQFTLLILEKGLASYVSAQDTFNDELSVRIDAADFSNITNGLGLFGAYSVRKVNIKISKNYIYSFGYKTAY